MAALEFLDVFAGAGGLSSGLAAAGFEPVGAVEAMEEAALTYEAVHGVEVDRRRLEAVPARELAALRGRVAVVAGGPPCQPWSTGGLRRGSRDTRDGFPALLKALELIRPEAFVIENVAGLARSSARGYLVELLAVLRSDLGYDVAARTLNAADYGVPQQRLRLFIVGTRRGGFSFPEPTHGPGRRRTAGEFLTVEPVGEPNPSIVTYARNPDLRPSPYDGLLFNGGGRPIDLAAPARTILASAGGNKTPFLDTLGVAPAYHRELTDALRSGGKPALRARVRSGVVPGARRLTVAECAALQTFPPRTRFHGRRSTQYTLVGNAVPPLLARAVGESLRAAILRP